MPDNGSEQCDSSGTFESLNGINGKSELISETSCSSSSSSSDNSKCCKTSKGSGEDKEYTPGRNMQVTAGSGSGNRKKARIRKRITPVTSRLYVCDWCFGRASFKSCQGLRFHKTLRCPERERKLGNGLFPGPLRTFLTFFFVGEDYFKCTKCKKAFVTSKGLNHHLIGSNHWPD